MKLMLLGIGCLLTIFSGFAQNVVPSTGNVGLGISNPTQQLHLGGGGILLDNNPSLGINGEISTGIRLTATGGWARGMGFLTNDNSTKVIYGAYGYGNSLNYAYIGPVYYNPWMVVTPAGRVGIANSSPAGDLSFQDLNTTNAPTGITWYSGNGDPTYYGIHRTAGEWNSPNYQQLRLAWNTGIVLDPGTLYGKSYVDIQGAGLRVTSGNVGVGTRNPSHTLEVVSGSSTRSVVRNTNGSDYSSLRLMNDVNSSYRMLEIDYSGSSYGGQLVSGGPGGEGASVATTGPYPLTFGTTNTARMVIAPTGEIGIGTINPTEKLSVNGNVRAKKIIVTQSGWADYVFDPSYDLRPLGELADYLQKHRHLPDIPTAASIEDEGNDLGKTQVLLLKKIEELTLYILAQEKRISRLESGKKQNK